ncbi:NAD(P)H-dependent oxidoreductase [Streptomyces sp. NPDC013978]|uniref:NAD(P)H-dependent oxidoreductase n=1 Tax=Streptomyces sp. NPDC013978 TaxID=3364869 RepID=UPI0036FBD81B
MQFGISARPGRRGHRRNPVYKAGLSGLLKSFADLIDNDLLIARPVVVAATGGSGRHAMVVLRANPVPTSLYAALEDWASADLGRRISRAARELSVLVRSGAGRQIADDNGGGYAHQFGGNATREQQSSEDVGFDTDLMRLATGGHY